jgi:hypothetical protein
MNVQIFSRPVYAVILVYRKTELQRHSLDQTTMSINCGPPFTFLCNQSQISATYHDCLPPLCATDAAHNRFHSSFENQVYILSADSRPTRTWLYRFVLIAWISLPIDEHTIPDADSIQRRLKVLKATWTTPPFSDNENEEGRWNIRFLHRITGFLDFFHRPVF